MPILPLGSHGYLHDCLTLYPEVARLRYGKPQDLHAVERAAAKVRSSRRLTYDDVRAIAEAPGFSAGAIYWQWPSKAEIDSALARQPLDLWNLPKNEAQVIKVLRTVFKSIEAISVILRFVVPEHYGILSVHVESLLGVRPSPTSGDKYLNYVRDLREIRNKRGFETAAQVDMALWALQVGIVSGLIDGHQALKKKYEQDPLLRQIRVRNLAEPLFDKMPRLDVAEALAASKPDLAGQLAALEFERAARAFANARPADDLSAIIKASAPAHAVGAWQRGRVLRNRAVHGTPLQPKEIEDLIALAREVIGLGSAKRGK